MVPAVGGKGGANVFWDAVDEEVNDIDPESGTGTSVPVAAGVIGNSWPAEAEGAVEGRSGCSSRSSAWLSSS